MPRKKKNSGEEFEVVVPMAAASNSISKPEDVRHIDMEHWEIAAANEYDPSNRAQSTVLNDSSTSSTISQDDIDDYATAPQADKQKTMEIINLIRQYKNKDDLIGLVVEAIENNVNARYRLHWRDARHKDVDKKANEEVKKAIAEFNEKINLKQLIRDSTAATYQDGNYIMCLRSYGKSPSGTDLLPDYVVDTYPIGVAEISQYTVGGDPYVLIDMNTLKSQIRKSYTKTKKNKALFYENETKEIEATFPKEVVDAYKAGERYAKLDIKYTGVERINNDKLQYGLSPIFRAFTPMTMLELCRKADRMALQTRSKKIVAQYLNKEILGPNWNADTYRQQAYAHKTLLAAWANNIVLVTAPATVREIAYVEPKGELTNIEVTSDYRNQIMSTLGISFLADGNSKSLTIANLSVKQLMKNINKITKQLETILHKWYKVVLQEAGMDPSLAPTITVIDAEMLEMDLRMELADILFSKFNASYETVFELIGYNVEDEKAKREIENDEGYDQIFTPRQTVYTTNGNSGDDSGGDGRPADKDSNDPDKQADDQQRNKSKKEL